MSLFGNAGSGAPSGGSLFGASAAATSGQTGSSLFGTAGAANTAQPQQQQTTTSLFGGLGKPPASGGAPSGTTTGLFGNTGAANSTSQPSSTPSLFGNLGGPAQANNTTTTTNTPNLFGTSTTAAPATSTGGLFGRVAPADQKTTTTTTPATGGGLLGGSLFGAKPAQPATTQPATGGGLLGGLGASIAPSAGQQQQQQAQTLKNPGPLEQSINNGGTQNAYFDHLLERGKKRGGQVNGGDIGFGELPSLQLGLGDIARKVRNLGGGGPSAQQAAAGKARDTKAHYLLAASGVTTGATLRDLNAFNASTGLTTTPALNLDTDIDGYLANLQSQSTLDLIAEGLEQSKRDFDAFLENNVQMEWDNQRRRIYEHFGLVKQGDKELPGSSTASPAAGPRGAFGRSSRRGRTMAASTMGASMSFGASGMARSVIGTPSGRGVAGSNGFGDSVDKAAAPTQPGPENRLMREKQEKYMVKVRDLNLSRLHGKLFPVLKEFADVEASSSVNDNSKLVGAYQALVNIIGENPAVEDQSHPGAVKERAYRDAYLDEQPSAKGGVALRKRILDGSRRWLEETFFRNIEAAIAKNPQEAQVGGIPSVVNQVRGYIRLQAARKELSVSTEHLQEAMGDFTWVLIYYLLRSGKVDEAAAYVAENERIIKSFNRFFPQFIKDYASSEDRRLNAQRQTQIQNLYQQYTRVSPENAHDPYLIACLKIIGRCELSKRSLDKIKQDAYDWLWVNFSLAREVNRVEEVAGEAFGLEDIRTTIVDIGQRHFQGPEAASTYDVFFQLQILAGLFESAINFLYQHNYVSAVHFAIALDYYGLLRVSDLNNSPTEILSYSIRQKPQICFGRMLGHYTRDFRAAKPEAATDYLALICLNADLEGKAGEEQAAICHEALRELVLETREFAELIGDVDNKGNYLVGAIAKRLPLLKLSNQDEFLKTITLQAASVADDAGRTSDAVLLYHLAREYEKVVEILCRALSDAISVDLGQEHMKLEPVKPRGHTQPAASTETSLSMAMTEDPFELASVFASFYGSNALYMKHVKQQTRQTMNLLLEISKAKREVEAGRWANALDIIQHTHLLPIDADGDVGAIRAVAQTFNQLAPVIARNIGPLLLWTIRACAAHRDGLLQSAFAVNNTNRQLADRMLTVSRDLMVFAGLVRYKLPPRVFEALAAVGGEVGAY